MQKAFLKDLLTYLPSKLLPALTVFITAPIITHLFLPADYGYWVLADGFAGFLSTLACSGIGAGVVRFYANYKIRLKLNEYFTTLIVCIGIAVIPVSLGCFAGLFILKGYLPTVLYPLLLIAVLSFAIQAIYSVYTNVVIAQERSGLYTTFELVTRYCGIGLSLFLVIVFGLRMAGLMWGNLIIICLAIPFLYHLATNGAKVGLKYIHTMDTSQMWHYALPLSIGNMAMWGLRLSDRYVIALYRPASDVGLYSAAYNLSGKSIDIIAALFGLSMFPILMKVWETRGREEAENTVTMFTRLYLIIGMPAVVGLTIYASPFISIFTAPAYHEGYQIVGYVAFSGYIWELSQIASYGILIKKKTGLIAFSQIVASVANLGLNFILVPRYGFVVAGVTTLIGYLILLILQILMSRPYLTWKFPWRTLRNTVIASIIMSLISLTIYSLSGDIMGLHWVYIFLGIVIAIPVYFASLWLLGEADSKEMNVIRHFFSKPTRKSTI